MKTVCINTVQTVCSYTWTCTIVHKLLSLLKADQQKIAFQTTAATSLGIIMTVSELRSLPVVLHQTSSASLKGLITVHDLSSTLALAMSLMMKSAEVKCKGSKSRPGMKQHTPHFMNHITVLITLVPEVGVSFQGSSGSSGGHFRVPLHSGREFNSISD